jgi:hypothetical protein
MKKKLYLVTKGEYGGRRRKLAFFSRQPNDLYCDFGGLFMGSHLSYHRDGNVFRTSPATENRPRLVNRVLPLEEFKGWYQLGTAMILRQNLASQPTIRSRDLRGETAIIEIDVEEFPGSVLNLVVELFEPGYEPSRESPETAPPLDAHVIFVKELDPWIIITVLGHDHNILIRPLADGFRVSHINSRYTANSKGVDYTYEAYGQ